MNAGDHLVSSRVGYSHHGIYVGNGEVIHYSGFSEGMSGGDIELTSLENFSQGNDVWVEVHLFRRFSNDETVERAWSRLSEDGYNVVLNNCEQFANWCVNGVHHSAQVTSVVGAALIAANVMRERQSAEVVSDIIISAAAQTIRQTTGRTATKAAVGLVANTVSSGSSASTVSGVVGGSAAGVAASGAAGGTVASFVGVATLGSALAPVAIAVGVGYGIKKLWDWW